MSVVQTVLGPIAPYSLGRTLTHEHLALDFEGFKCAPPLDFKEFFEKKISLNTIGFVRQYPYSSLENITFCDEEARRAVISDIELYKRFGGGSIVENSSHGLKRNLEFMVHIQKTTGVHVIAGTGHYIHDVQTPDVVSMTVEQMTDMYSKEIITGVDVPNIGQVKCGFIGEVGSVYPINDFEKRAIRATGEIQEVLGCGVSFHPGRDAEAPFEIVRLYLEAGGKADKCVMSHLDRTIFDMEQLLEFAALGTYVQYDLFGVECSYYQLNRAVDMPSDAQRINNFMALLEDGWVDKLLMSHDIHTKHRLTAYGGHGYHHVHMNILPRLFAKGVTIEQVDKMTITNPSNWLQLKI